MRVEFDAVQVRLDAVAGGSRLQVHFGGNALLDVVLGERRPAVSVKRGKSRATLEGDL